MLIWLFAIIITLTTVCHCNNIYLKGAGKGKVEGQPLVKRIEEEERQRTRRV